MEYGKSSALTNRRMNRMLPPNLTQTVKDPVSQISWRAAADASGLLSVHVSAADHPAVFSESVGVMSLNGFNILEAKSFRNRNQTIVMLKVTSVNGQTDVRKRLRQAKKDLDGVVQGRINLPLALRKKTAGHHSSQLQTPPEVSADDKTSYLFTLIHVSGSDFPGILFMITDAIVKCGLTIWNSKINTVRGAIDDVFYVKDQNGNKLNSPEQAAVIQAKLRNSYKLLRYI